MDSTSDTSKIAIPELERRRVERALDKFCDRVPVVIRSKLAGEYRFRGNTLVVHECRPHFQNPKRQIAISFARFVYSPTVGG